MKKYIRTKEGNIYQRFFIDKSIRGVGGGGCCDKNLNPIGETVIKESDTIEELIDEFVSEHIILEKQINKTKTDAISKLDYAIRLAKKGFVVYGSIWVDSNLIKVAKMNEKGELELL